MIHYLLPADQDDHMRAYMKDWGGPVAEWFHLQGYETLLEEAGSDSIVLEPGTYILSALDQLSPAMLRVVTALHEQLAGRTGFRFLNHPSRTLRRFELLTELNRLDRSAVRAVRATGRLEELRYPVFIRGECSHDGALSPLLHSPREVVAALGRAVTMRGRRPRDLLVVEFCPTADRQGVYRKYAAFVVGERILARSLDVGRAWMLKHDRTEFSEPTLLEQRDYVFGNPHARELAEIAAIAGVGYGRIDYAIKDGRIQVWEINLHPAIGRRGDGPVRNPVPAELEPLHRQTKERFYAAFHAALAAVDTPRTARAGVIVAVDPKSIRAARPRTPRRWRSSRALIKLLAPARPLLEPTATPLFPLVGRLARRGSDVTPSSRGAGSAASSDRTSRDNDQDHDAPSPPAGR